MWGRRRAGWRCGRCSGWVGDGLASTFMINHFDLFGLRQVYLAWREKPYTHMVFRLELLYRLVRHPIMLGFFIAFWAAPTMTAGHLLFAIATTGYILIALQFEEHDLVAAMGNQYRDYRRDVPMLLPLPHRHATRTLASTNSRAALRSAPTWRSCLSRPVWASNRW